MPDRYWGRIQFPVSMIDEDIREALEAEGVDFDKKGRPVTVYGFVQVEDGIFTLENAEAENGAFEDLEDTLKVAGVPFDRKSSEYFDYPAEEAIFRPGKNGDPPMDLEFILSDGEPFIKLSVLLDLMAQGIKAIRSYVKSHFPTYPPLSQYVKEVRKNA